MQNEVASKKRLNLKKCFVPINVFDVMLSLISVGVRWARNGIEYKVVTNNVDGT